MKETAYLLRIEEKLYRQFKVRCVQNGKSIKARLAELIRKDLERRVN